MPKEESFVVVPVPDPIVLGHQAGEALKNPAVQIALDKIEAEITHAWKTSAPKDEEAREHIYYQLQALAMFKIKLQGMVNNMRFEVKKTGQAQAA